MGLRIIFFLSAFLSLIVGDASAYIPRPQHIFGELAKGNKKIETLKIKETRTIFNSKYDGGKIDIKEEIYLKVPKYYMIVSTYQNRTEMSIYDGFRHLKVTGNKWFEPKEKFSLPFIFGFYLSSNADELVNFLSSKNIIQDNQSLARRGGIIAILFTSQDKTQARLWVDQDSFLPIAYNRKGVVEPGQQPLELETVFSNYQKISANTYYPYVSEKSVAGNVVERISVNEAVAGVKLAPNFFDINALKKKYPQLRELPQSDYPSFD